MDEVMVEEKIDEIGKLLDVTTQMSLRLEDLTILFDEKIKYSAHEEKIIDNMHKELQKYKEDMYAQLIRPILLDIIDLRDSLMRVSSAYREKLEGEQCVPNKTFFSYSYDLQDILEKNSVIVFNSCIGDEFIPLKHRAIDKIVTDDASLHGKIAQSLSSGYIYKDKPISAEKVTIYYFEESQVNEAETANEMLNENNEVSEVVENG